MRLLFRHLSQMAAAYGSCRALSIRWASVFVLSIIPFEPLPGPQRSWQQSSSVASPFALRWLLRYDDGCPLWGPELTALGLRGWREGPPTPNYLRTHSESTCQALGTRYTLHSLRQAFCSRLAMMGESLQDIAAWAHHSSAQTTERWYAHLRPRGRDGADRNREGVVTMWSHCIAKCKGAQS